MRFLFGDCELDIERYELRRAGQTVALEPKAFKVLTYLVQRHGRAVVKDDLCQEFWPGTSADSYKEYSLRNCLNKIRQVVGDAGTQRAVIETLRSYGYRFAAPVTIVPTAPEEASTPPQSPANTPLSPAPPAQRHPLPGRRQLTVLCCGLVATARLERLDPDDFRTALQAFYTACERAMQPFDGYIAQYDSDGLLVYFGYPYAHEDAAQRAVRAGLALVEALQRLLVPVERASGLHLAVRLSIHTGQVVIDEPGDSAHGAPAVSGVMLSVAKRRHERATSDTVVISADTYHLVQGYFACEVFETPRSPSDDGHLTLYRVLGENGTQSRFGVAIARGLTPLVGRTAEVALLLDRWAQVKEGLGQVVLVSGEPGIGKSRLVQVLKDQVADDVFTLLECRCSPYHTNSALYPVINLLQRALQWASDDTFAEKLRKLETALAQLSLSDTETVPLFASLLGLPLPAEQYPPLTLSPQRQKQKTLEAFVAMVLVLAARQPVVFIVEDLHWVDPSTLELLSGLVDQVPTASILTLMTFRPTFEPPWSRRMYVTSIALTRLSRQQVEMMITQVADGKLLPAAISQQVVTKTDGVPLFVEELTKMVLESDLVRENDDHYELTGALSPLAIPATLHDSLMARLDRHTTVKTVAQLGATIGRQFSYDLLQAVAPLDEVTLQQELARLVEAEVLYQRGIPPQATYLFKHALIQDAAYQSLLRSTRQQYHQRIAQVLEERFSDIVEAQPELLAHHYTESDLRVQAIAYWQRAGQQARQRSANLEAIQHLTTGLELLATLPESPVRDQQELDLQIALGPALMAAKGWAAPEVEQTYARARALCAQVGDTPQLFTALRGLCTFYQNRGALPTARELCEQFYRLTQRQAAPIPRLEAHQAFGSILFVLGDYAAARTYLERGIALTDPAALRALVLRYDVAPGVQCLVHTAATLWCLGYPAQAMQRVQEALTLAQELAHPYSLGQAQFYAVILSQRHREASAVQERAEALLTLATAQGWPLTVGYSTCMRGWALVVQGQGEAGLAQLRQGIAALSALEQMLGRPFCLVLLAEAAGRTGQVAEGLRLLGEALAAFEASGRGDMLTEAYRLQGELLLRQATPDATQAEVCFQQALAIARRQQAKSWELRAATSLSRLWQWQGKCTEARELLAPVYGWFTEGFDTADLQEAKKLLEELE